MRQGAHLLQVDIVHTFASIASREIITNVLTRQITYVIINLNAAQDAAPPPRRSIFKSASAPGPQYREQPAGSTV